MIKLPGPALALTYVTLCSAPLLLSIGRPVAPLDTWEAGAAAAGMVGLAGMAVQFVTSGRFESVSGRLGIDRIMAFHKFAAWWVLAALLLHPLLYVLPTWMERPDLGFERLVAYATLPHYRSGGIALALVLLLVLTSALRDRLAWRYEVWRGLHVILALGAVGAGLHHALETGRFAAGSGPQVFWWALGGSVGVVILVLYGWRWLKLHRRPWKLEAVEKRADRMWELDIQPVPGTPALPYRAGQFVWMSEGRRRFPLFDHPFSIADSPQRPGLSLIIKEAGDFTNDIGKLQPGTAIGIDGPYGDFVIDPGDKARAILLLAGGVGMAPIMGLLRDLAARRDPRPVRLGYAAGKPENFACLAEIEAARSVLDLRVLLVSEEGSPGWQGDVGRLDAGRLATLLDGLDLARTQAMICGPGPMVTGVSDSLLDLGMPTARIHYERFDYGGGASSRMDRRRSLALLGVGAALATLAAALAQVIG